ncbi:MAG TPA: aldolase/citrate lyase family protein [Bryobacteraceae bacterium]|jgi:4-hydroxy-2-oxoheptanedioate aldolase|nr:aldolase/citrate lyase family protein [Bryobacteraceae bacterium]
MNSFKSAIARHEPQIGLRLALADSYCAEICTRADFDWLLIDGEHAPNGG